MIMKIMVKVYLASLILLSLTTYSQSRFTLSMPLIYSKVEVANNWSPPTAVNRKNQFDGTALGYGVNLNYSFRPTFIIKNQWIFLNVGMGYFKQGFDLERPFDYVSPLQPIFYTDYYSYHCLQWSVGVSYKYSFNPNYFLTGSLSYSWLHSFQQEYTLLYTYLGSNRTQVNHNQIDFGNSLNLSVGFNKSIGSMFSVGLNILAPLYTRWRNDKIFKDDPSEFSNPRSSLGSSISICYRLNRND